jgi:hypothetical protein
VGERGHPTHVVDDELARAVRTEAAVAVRYWWGVSVGVVARWRKALGVGRADNPGSVRLIRRNARAGGQVWQRRAAERGLPLFKQPVPWWAEPRRGKDGRPPARR